MIDPILVVLEKSTIFLLVISLALFTWSALSSKNIRKFQFQMSVFIIIWIIGEMIRFFQHEDSFTVFNLNNLGSSMHTISMIFFSVMLWVRFYYSKKSGKMMIEMQ